MSRSKADTIELNRLVAKYPQFDINKLIELKKIWANRKNGLSNGETLDRAGNPYFMLLTFDEWLDIWLTSGKLHLRGNNKGDYVLMRSGPDIGNYEIGNVSVGLKEENSSDANKGVTPYNKGKPATAQQLKNLNQTGRTPWNKDKTGIAGTGVKKPTGKCGHCGLECAKNVLARFHNGNCKKKKP